MPDLLDRTTATGTVTIRVGHVVYKNTQIELTMSASDLELASTALPLLLHGETKEAAETKLVQRKLIMDARRPAIEDFKSGYKDAAGNPHPILTPIGWEGLIVTIL